MKKVQKIRVNQLLNFIPESLLANLAINTKVDHYSKVLHGKKMFYLLLYGIVENERLSQRTLEDTFNDPVFKLLFNLEDNETVVRSSISERLSKIDPDYFKQIYECIYKQFSIANFSSNQEHLHLIRVDSSIVSETAGKLQQGISSNQSLKKSVKYSIAFDGILPCYSNVFTTPSYSSEDIALPEVIRNHVKKDKIHQNIYVIDRGLQSTKTMNSFKQDRITFICRAKENRKYEELESFITKGQDIDLGEATLLKDSKVYLYTGTPINNKKGNIHYKETLVEESLRLIVAQSKTDSEKQFWFITNDFKLSAKQVAQAYRRRWDIEVFFRFIKQELNVSHLVSLNKNGIEVILYMTLIAAMLIIIYKNANQIGYKTAKRRFKMEVRNLVIAEIVIECGGNPDIFFNKT